MRHHHQARHQGDHARKSHCKPAQCGRYRKTDPLPCNHKGVGAGQIVLMEPSQQRKGAVQQQVRTRREHRKARRLQTHGLPKDLLEAEGRKPEKRHPCRQDRAPGEQKKQNKASKNKQRSAPAPGSGMFERIDVCWQCASMRRVGRSPTL